jgi:hypothetical protein
MGGSYGFAASYSLFGESILSPGRLFLRFSERPHFSIEARMACAMK